MNIDKTTGSQTDLDAPIPNGASSSLGDGGPAHDPPGAVEARVAEGSYHQCGIVLMSMQMQVGFRHVGGRCPEHLIMWVASACCVDWLC